MTALYDWHGIGRLKPEDVFRGIATGFGPDQDTMDG